MNLLLLIFALATIANAQGSVSWFVQVSDLHFSDSEQARNTELVQLFQTLFPKFNFSSILITGDMVHSKKGDYMGKQRVEEWEQYKTMLDAAKEAVSDTPILDIRGNHDTYDAGKRNGKGDMYLKYGASGSRWSRHKVLVHRILGKSDCPLYCLVGVDLAPQIGLRSPTNFFGFVDNYLIREIEEKVAEDMRTWYSLDCDPVYLAYGHYPLSIVASEVGFLATETHAIKKALLKYGIHVWLCGHLHDAFGNDLRRLHRGEGSALLELEVPDWKLGRKFRIVSLDKRQFSILTLSRNNESGEIELVNGGKGGVDGAIVMVTWPPDPYSSPLRVHREVEADGVVRALVVPLEDEPVAVRAEVSCADRIVQSINMSVSDSPPLYVGQSRIDRSLCQSEPMSVQVVCELISTKRVSISEERPVENRSRALDYPQSFLQRAVLKYPWCAIAHNLLVSSLLFHMTVLLILPKLLSRSESPGDGTLGAQSRLTRLVMELYSPYRGLITAAGSSRLYFWGQLGLGLLMLVGPWSFCRILSDKPLSAQFLATFFIEGRKVYAAELPLRGCFFYAFAILPLTLWSAWTVNRADKPQRKITTVLYCILGIAAIVWLILSMINSWLYYGLLSALLSPLLIGCLLVNGGILYSYKKCEYKRRRE